MKITKVIIGVCTAAILMSGCMTEDPIKQRASDDRIKLINSYSFTIELLSAKTMINDEGLLTVDARVLLSRTGYFRWVFGGDPQVTVWYHFTWIDANGNVCPPVQREMSVLPGNIIDLHGVAPEEKYINYHLTISLKGPEASQQASRMQNPELKETYIRSGKVKPAGKSQAKQIAGPKGWKKTAAKSEAKKPAAKSEAKKPAAKSEAKKPAAKSEAKKPAAKSAEKNSSKNEKLTEPFD